MTKEEIAGRPADGDDRAARPFRFGVLATQRASRDEWATLARRAEDLGFSSLLVPDHFDGQLAPMPALMAAADATSVLRVGTLVLNNDFRHPLAVAKEAATIDLLSDGRFELGLGAGFREDDYSPTGIGHDAAGARVDRLADAVRVIRASFGPDPVNDSGHYRITAYEGSPRPVQRRLPILIGGGGPRMLRLAASEADIVGIAADLGANRTATDIGRDYGADRIEQKLQWVREAAGDRFAELELQTMVLAASVTDDRDTVFEQLGKGFGLRPAQAGDTVSFLVGTVDHIVDVLVDRRARLGINYWVFRDDAMESVGPVVAQLTGK